MSGARELTGPLGGTANVAANRNAFVERKTDRGSGTEPSFRQLLSDIKGAGADASDPASQAAHQKDYHPSSTSWRVATRTIQRLSGEARHDDEPASSEAADGGTASEAKDAGSAEGSRPEEGRLPDVLVSSVGGTPVLGCEGAVVARTTGANTTAVLGEFGAGEDAASATRANLPETKAGGAVSAAVLAAVTVIGEETHFAAGPLPASVKIGAKVEHVGDTADGADAAIGQSAAASKADGLPTDAEGQGSSSHAASGRASEIASTVRRVDDVLTPEMAGTGATRQVQPQGTSDAQLSPVQQIARQITAEAAAPENGTDNTTLNAPWAKPADAPMKALRIQLHPLGLGTVTIRMALKNDALELRVEASRSETARLIQQDREALSQVLRSVGYAIGEAAVHVSVASENAGSAGTQPSLQSREGWSHSGARDSGGNEAGAGRNAWGAGHNENEDAERRPAGDSAHLFV